jgi:ribonuclease BN (tRNA processing enzyme)
MRLTLLGTGSAFTLENSQTNYLVEIGDFKMLIDCGSDCRKALYEVTGLTYNDINAVFITHLHDDHCYGLPWLGFAKYFARYGDPTKKLASLYVSKSLVDPLWNNCLSGSMLSIEGKVMTLNDYFNVIPLDQNEQFKLGDAVFQPVQTVHVMNGFYITPSFGLLIYIREKAIFITGDTQFCPEQLIKFYDIADIIFHDCEVLYTPDGKPIESKVHAHYERLKTSPYRNKKVLIHYQDGATKLKDAIKDGFLGFGLKGEVYAF